MLLTQLPVASARDLSAPYRAEMVTIRPGLENLQLASGNKSFTEHAFQSLHPRHGPMPLFWRLFQPVVGGNFSVPSSLSPLAWGDMNSVFTVRG